jgi:hypothetical protein
VLTSAECLFSMTLLLGGPRHLPDERRDERLRRRGPAHLLDGHVRNVPALRGSAVAARGARGRGGD